MATTGCALTDAHDAIHPYEFEDDELIDTDAFEADAAAQPLEPKPVEPIGSNVSWEQRTVLKRAWLTEDEFKAKYTQRVASATPSRATTKLAKLKKKHQQQVLQRKTHTKPLSSERYHELWMENVRLREAHKFREERVWLKDGVEAPTAPTTPRHRPTRPNPHRHIPNPVSKTRQQCIGMECSQCRTNEHMVEDPEKGLVCSNCRFELQCLRCHTLCDTSDPNMDVVQEPPDIGEYYWKCLRCDVLIKNYYPRLRCAYCKSDPTPTNLSANDNGVWQCLVCTAKKEPVCKNCKGNTPLTTEVEHGNEFKVCKQCGYRCDEVQLPDYMYSLTVGELKPNYDFKPGAKGTLMTGEIQKTDGKWVMNAKHYKQIRDICEAALRLLNVPPPRHSLIIRRVIDMVTIEMKDRNYRVDKHAVASLYTVLRNGETPISRKQFDSILPQLHIPLRGEAAEDAADDTIDKSSAMKSELTRSLKKIKAVSQVLAPTRNPWQSAEELVEKFLQQDVVLQRHFEGLPKADWGVMLQRGRYQVRYMHFVYTTQRPQAVVGKMLSSGYEHEVAGVCYYMTQLPLLMDRSQKIKGRTIRCKEQLRQQLQLRREPYYSELMPMVEEDTKLWQLPSNLGLSRYTQLCKMLQSYDYDHDYRVVARAVMQSMG